MVQLPGDFLLKDRFATSRVVDVGDWSYGGVSILHYGDDTRVSIGKFCSFGYNTKILAGGGHNTGWVTTFPFCAEPFVQMWPDAAGIEGHPKSRGDVVIGNDVWVGAEATIMSGVTVGDGAVIGARALVIGNVKPYEVVGGVPARHLYYRHHPIHIARLKTIAWWDWPYARIAGAMKHLLAKDVSVFCDIVEQGQL